VRLWPSLAAFQQWTGETTSQRPPTWLGARLLASPAPHMAGSRKRPHSRKRLLPLCSTAARRLDGLRRARHGGRPLLPVQGFHPSRLPRRYQRHRSHVFHQMRGARHTGGPSRETGDARRCAAAGRGAGRAPAAGGPGPACTLGWAEGWRTAQRQTGSCPACFERSLIHLPCLPCPPQSSPAPRLRRGWYLAGGPRPLTRMDLASSAARPVTPEGGPARQRESSTCSPPPSLPRGLPAPRPSRHWRHPPPLPAPRPDLCRPACAPTLRRPLAPHPDPAPAGAPLPRAPTGAVTTVPPLRSCSTAC
jgi:hypothetical protein